MRYINYILQASVLIVFLSACGGGGGGSSVSPALTGDGPNPISVTADLAFSDDGSVEVDVLANDSEENGLAITLVDVQSPSDNGASVVIDDKGTADPLDDRVFYQAGNPSAGFDAFTYTVENEDGRRRRGQVQVFNIVAVPDQGSALFNGDAIELNVLANDLVGDGNIALLDSFDAASAQDGTITLNDGGTPGDTSDDRLNYTPPEDFFGTDQFSYRLVIAEGAFATGTVFVEVAPDATCNQQQADKQLAGEKYCVEMTMASHDGTTIAFQLFVPAMVSANLAGDRSLIDEEGAAPLLIHSHGYGGNKAEDFFPAGTQLDRQVALDAWTNGYWVISYTQRGFGGTDGAETPSGGAIELMSPAFEGLDFVRLVDWAICHLRKDFDPLAEDVGTPMDPEAGCTGGNVALSQLLSDDGDAITGLSDDPAIGAIGYSYGGGFQYNAQSIDARLDAIMPLGTWHDLRFSLHPNDTPKIAWITLLTTFSEQGGNSTPRPPLIINANVEANGSNTSDGTFSKPRQVSVGNMNLLAPNGGVAYCDDRRTLYAADSGDADGDPTDYPETLPANAANVAGVVDRRARADAFLIQGYGDTLFNFNEGWDNTRCFKDAGNEVATIFQISGHPLPGVGPPHYAGQNTGMYLDEIVHCGVDGDGDPVRYNTRELGEIWFEDKLRGQGSFSSSFPHEVCITVENTDPNVVLDTADPFFNNGTSNADTSSQPTTANPGTNRNYQFPREGVVHADVADMLVGGTAVSVPESSHTTGPSQQPTHIDIYTQTTGSRLMAGIPTMQLDVSRGPTFKGSDVIFFAGIAVKRCHADPNDTGPCEANNPYELLHFQVSPVRLFPSAANETPPGIDPDVETYPKDDPRNEQPEPNHVYPVRWGDNLGSNLAEGRLPGSAARLNEGDVVALALYSEIGVYQSVSTASVVPVTVSGTVNLPLHAPSDRPDSSEPYLVPAP